MNLSVFRFLGNTIESVLTAFVSPAASSLMTTLQITTMIGATLYLTLTGYAIVTGAVEAPFYTFLKQCVKIIIISVFALTADGYLGGVVGALNGLEDGLAQAMGTLDGQAAPSSIYDVLDQSLNHGFDLVALAFEKANEAGFSGLPSAIGWIIAGLIIAIGTLLMTLLGGAMVIVAKFALAMMFALGPLFIMCLMFPATAKFFDSWFSQVMNYVLTIVFMAVIMSFATRTFDSFVSGANLAGDGGQSPIIAALQIAALTGVLCWIILQASNMASGLAGGMSIAAMSLRHLAMPATAPVGAAKTIHNVVNPTSTRRDLQSGMMVSARRGSHLLAGNTMLNPAYRQHLRDNIGKNWGRAAGGSVSQRS